MPELIAALKARKSRPAIFCGGVIPEADYEFLRTAGVDRIFGPGTNVIAAANAVMDVLEGRSSNR